MTDFDIFLPTPIDFLRRYFQQSTLHMDLGAGEPIPAVLRVDNKSSSSYLVSKYCPVRFAEAASVLDRAVLDIGSLKFKNSVLAAAVFLNSVLYTKSKQASDEYFQNNYSP